MLSFLIYEGKVAVALLVFYLFYRFLLKKETFHRFNRVVLVGTAVLSFLLPFCIITIHRPMEMVPEGFAEALGTPAGVGPVAMSAAAETAAIPWWPMALTILFFAGVGFVLLRLVISLLSIRRIVRRGECIAEEDGCRIIVTDRDIDPFSWMRHIVLSRKDWEAPHDAILTHEKAHIAYGHSADMLLVSILSAFQWFNPAIWMLRTDLQELHEYEADDAVLRSGANLKEYQYLLIRKAVGKSGYSVANSFNHSILKNRITMMSKTRSPLARGLRVLWLLPLVCLGLGLQARTVYVPSDKDSEKILPDEQPEAIVLHIKADGKIESGGKTYTVDQLKQIIPPHEDGQSLTTVQIVATDDVRMGAIEDVKEELRRLGSLKIQYTSPSGREGTTRYMPPLPRAQSGKKSADYPEVVSPDVDRENLLIVRINSRDKYLFGNKPLQDDEEMLRLGKYFLRERGREARISLQADRGTSYGAYRHMQELLVQIFMDIRDEKALEQYGKHLSELSTEERNQINYQVPLAISEAETKKKETTGK